MYYIFQTTSEYVWTKREKAEEGTSFDEIINFVSLIFIKIHFNPKIQCQDLQLWRCLLIFIFGNCYFYCYSCQLSPVVNSFGADPVTDRFCLDGSFADVLPSQKLYNQLNIIPQVIICITLYLKKFFSSKQIYSHISRFVLLLHYF